MKLDSWSYLMAQALMHFPLTTSKPSEQMTQSSKLVQLVQLSLQVLQRLALKSKRKQQDAVTKYL